MEKISLVIPCYNEIESLPFFYREICEVGNVLSNYSFQFLFINDGSKDGTLDIIKEFAQQDKRVQYISFSRNFGKESAIYAGLGHAQGDYVAIMDADMQDPPMLIIEMILHVKKGFDCCATRRVNRIGEPPIRSYFARKFYRLINIISDVNIVDGARDYRLMTRKMVDAIISISERERFSKGIFSWVGFDTKWLEYENKERIAGETKWSFWSLFKYAAGGIFAFSTAPLKIATLIGIGISVCSFIYFAYIIIRTLILGVDVPGYASIISLLSLILGINMMAIGILGEYIGRIYVEVKRRPIYLIKESNVVRPILD